MKSSTSERLREIMRERNIKQADIVRLAEPYCAKFRQKLGRNDISQFVSGKVKPGQWRLTILGLALNVSEAWLMGYDVPRDRDTYDPDLPSNILPLPKTRKVPLLGTIACGEPILATENIAAYLDVAEEIHCDFALRCKGDSMMDARILDGDVVYIRHQPDVENGEIAAVLIDGMETEATLKRVYKSEGQLMLTPANAAYSPLVFIGEDIARVRILGKAVAFASLVR